MVERTIVTDVGVSINKVWQVFEAEPKNCDEVFAAKTFVNSGDVSGTKTGVRCAGSGCDYKPPPGNIDVLEMNFHGTDPVYHWSKSRISNTSILIDLTQFSALYKDRGWTMVGCKSFNDLTSDHALLDSSFVPVMLNMLILLT